MMQEEGLARAKALLGDRLGEKVRLDELAAAAGLSKFHLLRRFRAMTGMTPGAYRRHLRIEAAKQALRQGESPSQVALAFGFVDQSHFTRAFRTQTGVTPARFARGGAA
jgi:AraC-like DNA-binding protein